MKDSGWLDKVYIGLYLSEVVKEYKSMNAEQRLITLELSSKQHNFTARQIGRLYAEKHDYIDWHEFSNYLGELHNKGLLIITGHDINGMCVYDWNR